jgi:hypothetical protein
MSTPRSEYFLCTTEASKRPCRSNKLKLVYIFNIYTYILSAHSVTHSEYFLCTTEASKRPCRSNKLHMDVCSERVCKWWVLTLASVHCTRHKDWVELSNTGKGAYANMRAYVYTLCTALETKDVQVMAPHLDLCLLRLTPKLDWAFRYR